MLMEMTQEHLENLKDVTDPGRMGSTSPGFRGQITPIWWQIPPDAGIFVSFFLILEAFWKLEMTEIPGFQGGVLLGS